MEINWFRFEIILPTQLQMLLQKVFEKRTHNKTCWHNSLEI